DLKLLRLLLKDVQATGQGQVVMKVGGALASPVFEGRLQMDAQAVRHPDLPFPIDSLHGSAVFEESRLRVESLEFLAGGGPVQGSGEIVLGGLESSESPFAVRRAEIRLRGTNVKTEFPQGFRSTSDMDLTLRREPGATSLSGTVDLVRGVYGRDFKLDAALAGPRASEIFRMPAGGAFSGIDLDLVVRATQDVWLRNDFGTLEGQGELQIRGTTDHPWLAGRISAVEGGTIRFRRVPYRVLQGTVDFADPQEINPLFDLQAETRVSEYQVTLQAGGTLDDFHYELTSNPPLPEQDIVALLLTGRTLGSVSTEGGVLAEETISSVTGQLTGELTGRVSGRAGLDVLSIDPLQVNAKGDPTTRITVGKQVTPDLFVAYSNDVGSTQGSVYQLDYALDRDFHFTSIRDRDGSVGGDFRYILRGRPPAAPGIVEPAAAAPPVGAVRLEGELRFKERAVRRRLRVRAGRARDRAAINDGIDRLVEFYHRRGYLMAEVDSRETPGTGRAVDLTFHVNAGPRVEIDIRGTRGKAGLRQDIAPLWQKGLFLDDIVEQARAQIEKRFRDRGYLKISVASEVLRNEPGRFKVRFAVRRGPRARAREVRVAGTGRLPEKEIRKAIRTAPNGWFSRGLVRDAVLEEDAAAVRALYQARGFPLVSVPAPAVSLDDSGRHAVVTFRVEEGPQVVFGRPRFEGNDAVEAAALAKTA
ncbi:MAG TPA: translocation/assembly module TamB domain-containing protein, partial [Candidatus Dormibacteraeota bacterium]|nr:translocation/assembly module TamB domain-containing protein [Candidatus Dormibacteraeota bacterium]